MIRSDTCRHERRVYSGEYQATLQPGYASVCSTCGHFEWYRGPERAQTYGMFVAWKPEAFDAVSFMSLFEAKKAGVFE